MMTLFRHPHFLEGGRKTFLWWDPLSSQQRLPCFLGIILEGREEPSGAKSRELKIVQFGWWREHGSDLFIALSLSVCSSKDQSHHTGEHQWKSNLFWSEWDPKVCMMPMKVFACYKNYFSSMESPCPNTNGWVLRGILGVITLRNFFFLYHNLTTHTTMILIYCCTFWIEVWVHELKVLLCYYHLWFPSCNCFVGQ